MKRTEAEIQRIHDLLDLESLGAAGCVLTPSQEMFFSGVKTMCCYMLDHSEGDDLMATLDAIEVGMVKAGFRLGKGKPQ